jgi:hypothetical protein
MIGKVFGFIAGSILFGIGTKLGEYLIKELSEKYKNMKEELKATPGIDVESQKPLPATII